jgi:hypothetical protein
MQVYAVFSRDIQPQLFSEKVHTLRIKNDLSVEVEMILHFTHLRFF